MTLDASATRRRMPGAVLTAVILLGFFGALTGLTLLGVGAVSALSEGTLYGDAALPLTLVGALVLVMAVLGSIGLAKRNRGAQIVAITFGAMCFMGSLFGLRTNPAAALFGLAVGGALVLLVVAPVSSRDWFAS